MFLRVPTRSEIRAHLDATGGTDSLEALAAFTAALREEDRRAFLSMYHEERTAMGDARRHASRAWKLAALVRPSSSRR